MVKAVALPLTLACVGLVVAGCGGGGHPTAKEVVGGLTAPKGCVVTVALGKEASGGTRPLRAPTKQQIERVRTLLRSDPRVRTFAFISKKLRLQRLGRKYPALTKNVIVNPLPDSFEVVAERHEAASSLEASLGSFQVS